MSRFREAREALLYAFSDDLIDGEEFILLYDLNTSKNRDFEHWIYQSFDLNEISEDELNIPDDDSKDNFLYDDNELW